MNVEPFKVFAIEGAQYSSLIGCVVQGCYCYVRLIMNLMALHTQDNRSPSNQTIMYFHAKSTLWGSLVLLRR